MLSQVSFIYNDPDFLGQTVFIKRGKHQGKLGVVKKVLSDDIFQVSLGDFADDVVEFKRQEFLVYRHRKLKMKADRNETKITY
ncbi:MAG: KOW motif [Idiomarinaceae bacterium HL-53]|nr:MAG: KOW motif [Idiomarinaceae bacterium HL-53]CUS48905.1 KOW motif [Idiomarinaceae bacterium HL-53]